MLLKIEEELAHADAAEDQIGKHATTIADRSRKEIEALGKKLKPTGNDPDDENDYLWLLAQRHKADHIVELARAEREKRGG